VRTDIGEALELQERLGEFGFVANAETSNLSLMDSQNNIELKHTYPKII
jgi:hypothetical protein